jgi:hypothetical protein
VPDTRRDCRTGWFMYLAKSDGRGSSTSGISIRASRRMYWLGSSASHSSRGIFQRRRDRPGATARGCDLSRRGCLKSR